MKNGIGNALTMRQDMVCDMEDQLSTQDIKQKTARSIAVFFARLLCGSHFVSHMRCSENAVKESSVAICIVQDHIIRGAVFLWLEHDPAIGVDLQNKQLPFVVHTNVTAAIARKTYRKIHPLGNVMQTCDQLCAGFK